MFSLDTKCTYCGVRISDGETMPHVCGAPAETITSVAVEKIDRAAINLAGDVFSLPRPARHNDVISEMERRGMRYETGGRQGFLTDCRRFVDRKEGLRIATAAGQMKNTPHPSGDLFSEDLW